MSTTVQALITVMLRHLQEESTLDTGLWTEAELITYIADADREFITLSGVVKQVNNVRAVTSQSTYSEPSDSIDVERLSWNGKKVYPQTRFELDNQNPNWKADSGTPMRFHRDHLPPKQFEVWKKPSSSGIGYTTSGTYGTLRQVSGSLTYTTSGTFGVLRRVRGSSRNYYIGTIPYAHTARGPYGTLRQVIAGSTNFILIYDQLPPAVTQLAHIITTPDPFARYVMYRALDRAWAKDGDGQDMERSQYCRIRFERGVKIAKRLIYGDTE